MLTVIVVSFNSFSAVKLCLNELLTSDHYEVIIVDNASTDGSVEKFKEYYPKVSVIALSNNIGYGRAANRAFEEVKTDYAFLLNPDMKAGVDSVKALEKRMNSFDGCVALLAPAVRESDFVRKGIIDKERIIGAAMLFNMSLVSPHGFFDENIFLFSEETELCYRLKSAGEKICLDSGVYMEHLSRQSSTPSIDIDYVKGWHFGWSRLYFHEKYGLATGRKKAWRVIFRYALKTITALNKRKRRVYKARFLGSLAFVRGQRAFLTGGHAQLSDRLIKQKK